MIVSHARRFIFFHNPKCAGTSFRNALGPHHDDPFTFWGIFPAPHFRNELDHSHIRLWELQQLFPHLFACTETYASVIFVRSPWERFLSAIDEHFKKFQPQFGLHDLPAAEQARVVERFVETQLTIAHITTQWQFVHFSPQLWQIVIGEQIVPRAIIPMIEGTDYFGRAFAALRAPVAQVPWHNRSPTRLEHVLAAPKVDQFVRNFYALDLAFFEARPDLAPLARKAA
jgi:Sulfotransferase family